VVKVAVLARMSLDKTRLGRPKDVSNRPLQRWTVTGDVAVSCMMTTYPDCYIKRSENKGRGVYGEDMQALYTSGTVLEPPRINSIAKHTRTDGHRRQSDSLLLKG